MSESYIGHVMENDPVTATVKVIFYETAEAKEMPPGSVLRITVEKKGEGRIDRPQRVPDNRPNRREFA